MLESFTIHTFWEHIGSKFRLYPDGSEPLEIELISATGFGGSAGGETPGRRQPSSIAFRGPGDV